MINLRKETTKPAAKKYDCLEFIVPDYYLCALILGDYSGLTDSEEIEINEFIESVQKKYGHANFNYDFEQDEPYFSWRNDINSMGGNVQKITLLVEIK